MKKELKIIILVLVILLAIILLGISVFYKKFHIDISKPYISNSETSLNKTTTEDKNNYKEAINEVEKRVQQEFDRLNEKNEI